MAKPRVFSLVRETIPSSSQHRNPIKGVQKTRKRPNGSAIFVERNKPVMKPSDPIVALEENDIASTKISHELNPFQEEAVPKPRKRPNSSAVEKKWRNECWTKSKFADTVTRQCLGSSQNVKQPSHRWDHESTALAEQLCQIAIEESQRCTDWVKDHDHQSRIKFNPKSLEEHHRTAPSFTAASNADGSMNATQTRDDHNEFVYDTYIRTHDLVASNRSKLDIPSIDGLESVVGHKFGVLIIEEQDQAEWDTYGDDEQNDLNWDSEGEDENGNSLLLFGGIQDRAG